MDTPADTTGTIEDSIRELLTEDGDAANEYLKDMFISRAMIELFHARRNAGLTQATIADRLNTTQSSIARLERDHTGSVTLKRFIEVALACGYMPLDIVFVPAEQLRQYQIAHPGAPATQVSFSAWQASQAPVVLKVVQDVQFPLSTSSATDSNYIAATGAGKTAGLVRYDWSIMQTTLWSATQGPKSIGGQVA